MKTTLDLPDDLLERSREIAQREGATLHALVEEGLRRVIDARTTRDAFELPSYGGEGNGAGRTYAMRNASWDRIRAEIYGKRT